MIVKCDVAKAGRDSIEAGQDEGKSRGSEYQSFPLTSYVILSG